MEYYLHHDVNAAKNWADISARLLEQSCQHRGGWDMWHISGFLPAVLSDNLALIARFATLDTINIPSHDPLPFKDHEHLPKSGQFHVLALQYLLQHNWGKLHEMRQTAQSVRKNEFLQWFFEFCVALEHRDEAAMREIIERFLQPKVHHYLNQHLSVALYGQLLSMMPTMLTKIGWQNGIEMHFDNPLIPMALMPVTEPIPIDFGFEFPKPLPENQKPLKEKGFWARWFG